MRPARAEFGAFLRSRRDALSPAEAGIAAFPGPRRVPGLRKEELAVLAGLSPDYYSRLEQGRQANVSEEVLRALGRALRLDDTEQAHLHDLAAPVRRRPDVPERPQRAAAGLLRVLDSLGHLPALLLGARGEVLAVNALLRAVLGHPFAPADSFVRYLFQEPDARARIVNWSTFAAGAVAAMRRETAQRPHDARLAGLVDELRRTDVDAARWWDDHAVREYASMPKRIDHPAAGLLTFSVEVVMAPSEPDQHLVVYTVEPDSPTARVLPLLASWDTDPDQTASERRKLS